MTDEDTAAVLAVELEEPNPTMQPLEYDQRYAKWEGDGGVSMHET